MKLAVCLTLVGLSRAALAAADSVSSYHMSCHGVSRHCSSHERPFPGFGAGSGGDC